MSELLNENIELSEDTQKGKYLSFPIGDVVYAVEIRFVTEIIGIQPITVMPQMPSFIRGIINLRGKIIPVMDIRLRFNKEPLEYGDRTSIIVIEVNDISLGLIVDSVSEVLEISEENIVIPPDLNNDEENKFIKAIGKVDNTVSLILSCEKLISNDF